jgi:hypothetical protein
MGERKNEIERKNERERERGRERERKGDRSATYLSYLLIFAAVFEIGSYVV